MQRRKFLLGLQVLQLLSEEQRRELTPIQLRRKAREFALKTVKSQKVQFQRCAKQTSIKDGLATITTSSLGSKPMQQVLQLPYPDTP